MYGRPGNRLHWLALSFAPALLCLFVGQTALFALLGLVLFLRLYRDSPFLAGLSLWLCALKPHLFLPFGAVLLAWIVVSKSYRILAGAMAAMAASLALTWLIDPSAWSGYSDMMRASGIEKEFIPCLSVAMRLWLSPRAMWLQYLPAAVACAWALACFWPRRHAWDWSKDGSLLMLVSIARRSLLLALRSGPGRPRPAPGRIPGSLQAFAGHPCSCQSPHRDRTHVQTSASPPPSISGQRRPGLRGICLRAPPPACSGLAERRLQQTEVDNE